jgi:hypothetical protein
MPGTLNVGGHDIITHSGDAGAGDVTVNVQNRLVLDSSGKVGVGTSSPAFKLDVIDSSAPTVRIDDGAASGTRIAGRLHLGSVSTLGVAIENSVSSYNDNCSMVFKTTPPVGTITERMRIDSSGNVLVGKTNSSLSNAGAVFNPVGLVYFTRASGSLGGFNRTGNDGVIVSFYQDGTVEGDISVSGTTVSYNGGHLSRWSQLADNTRDESIVKGTVMSNLDQMAEWTNDGVTEDNEQLNCMKVSDVEGDINVAGVFVNWDNDDDIYTNDMNIAMTGDMVIRIAQGTTVQRGDLLMSAGDGTAKPQGDDIVRSKTIAKVTSTHISHTYEDGSYLVPCVLMAC